MRRSQSGKASHRAGAVVGLMVTLALGAMMFLSGVSPAFALPPGAAAPDFSGTTIDGRPVSLDSYHGKPLVLLFWGSW